MKENPKNKISGLVISKNESPRIESCLQALSFCDELLVIDSGSTDGTQKKARALGAQVFEHPFANYAAQKEYGRTRCTGDWILCVDADEQVSSKLETQIKQVVSSCSVETAAFRIPFRNHFKSTWVKRCGYYPDHHVRLFRKSRARWDLSRPVHEKLLIEGHTETLSGHINHYTMRSIPHFLAKSSRYAELFAKTAHQRGQKSGPFLALLRAGFRFFRAYILKTGFLAGRLGLVLSVLQAFEVYQKYIRLWELKTFASESTQSATPKTEGLEV